MLAGLIERYLTGEVLRTLMGVLLVLLVIFLSNQLVRFLADAAAGKLPGNIILALLALNGIKYLILLVPLSLYLAILLVLGRLYRDSEMTALAACGVGGTRLYRPIFLLAVPLALAQGAMALWLVPATEAYEYELIARARQDMEITAVQPGRFQEGSAGRRVFYSEEIEDGTRLHGVFIHLRREGGAAALLSADGGHLETDPRTGERYLVLTDGYRYEGTPGAGDFRMVQYDSHGLRLRPPELAAPAEPPMDTRPSAALWGAPEPAAAAELQWRLSMPLGVLTLALLAVPIGRVDPRSGRFGRLFVAVLIYVAYVNLLALAQTWTERSAIPAALGLWWVHGLVVLLSVGLLMRQYGGWRPRAASA